MVNIFQRFKRTFLPSAEEGARRRLQSFGTTSKKPAILRAAGIAALGLPVGRLAGAAAGIFRGTKSVAPIARGISTVASTAGKSSILTKAAGVYERALGNPLGAGGLKGFLGRITGRTLGGVAVGAGSAFTEAAITGSPVDITPRRLGYAALGFGLGGPVGSLAGAALGSSKNIGKKAAQAFQNLSFPHPNIPSPFEAGMGIGETFKDLGTAALDFGQGFGSAISMPGSISASYGPSVSPSFAVGGGGFDASSLAVLAALFGVGGYALGRKKRKKKKKKSKKGRSHRK